MYAWSYAHFVKIDHRDNIWVADKGSDMVIEFNSDGHATSPWDNDKTHLQKAAPCLVG